MDLWWTHTPPYPGHRTGLIGHYYARSDGPARQLLAKACQVLHGAGCTIAIGPMDGSVLGAVPVAGRSEGPNPSLPRAGQSGRMAADLMSPQDFILWPAIIRRSTRHSTRMTHHGRRGLAIAARRVHDSLAANAEYFDDELRRIHGVPFAAFEGEFLFTSISAERFL